MVSTMDSGSIPSQDLGTRVIVHKDTHQGLENEHLALGVGKQAQVHNETESSVASAASIAARTA